MAEKMNSAYCKARAIAQREGETFSAVVLIAGKRFVLKDAFYVARDVVGSNYAIGSSFSAFYSIDGQLRDEADHKFLESKKWTRVTPSYTEAERAAMQEKDPDNTYKLVDGNIVMIKRPYKGKAKEAKKTQPRQPEAVEAKSTAQAATAAVAQRALTPPAGKAYVAPPQKASYLQQSKRPMFQSLGRAIIKSD